MTRPVEKKIYKAIDLFAGIGGIRLGFEQAFGKDAIKFVYSNEIDKWACETYRKNYPNDKHDPEGDITKQNPEEIPDFDLLLAGFPCQAFSIAGRRKGFEDIRGTLFFYVANIIHLKRPVAFLLENVKNLKTHDQGRTFQVIKDVLELELGYTIYYSVLNAKNYGVPQNRERIFIVGFRDNLAFEFPKPNKSIPKLSSILQSDVDPSYYLSQEYLNGLKRHRARHEAKGHGFGYEVRPKDGISNAIVCGGMGKERNLIKEKPLRDCWKKEGDSIRLRNSEGIRKMTEREWARLQGYPEEFEFPVAKTKVYKQLGNSVAVPVIKAIAEKMKETLSKNVQSDAPLFNEQEKMAINLLEALCSKKAIPKTGKKRIDALERFIEKKAVRIDSLERILKIWSSRKIIDEIGESWILFSPSIRTCKTPENFRKIVLDLFKKNRNSQIIDKFISKSSAIMEP